MMRVVVLMTVHNRQEKTLKCLECLYANPIPEGFDLAVYMTDDGCTDGTPEAVEEKYPDVHIVKGDGTLYWNRGMWTAWKEAAKEEFDFYLWLNDDTNLYSKAINLLLSTSKDYNDEAIVVGATENSLHTTITYGGHCNKEIPKPSGLPIEIGYFNGNVVLIPHYVYHQLGNLDYRFRHSKGDFDYGIRARKAGIKMIQVGDVVGECELHKTIDTWCNPDVGWKERLKVLRQPTGMDPKEFFYFDRKHKGLITASFHVITIYMHCLFPRFWKNG